MHEKVYGIVFRDQKGFVFWIRASAEAIESRREIAEAGNEIVCERGPGPFAEIIEALKVWAKGEGAKVPYLTDD